MRFSLCSSCRGHWPGGGQCADRMGSFYQHDAANSITNESSEVVLARGRITLYLLLFSLIAINYADRIALSVGAGPIAMGSLFPCFLWSYVVCLLPWGMLTARVGIRIVSIVGIGLWSAATM